MFCLPLNGILPKVQLNKMKIKPILFLVCLALAFVANAQQLKLSGKITFERKENMHKQFEEESGPWMEQMKKRMPKYRTDFFQLTFNKHKSVYRISQEEENPVAANQFWRVSWNNAVMMDLAQKRMQSEKSVYDRNYHIDDSIPVYTWKVTGEYREIAGHLCRKATTIIMDSLYIIAFYTDEIPVSSGPESFTGLPGMILGVVIPKLYFTIFATKVETQLIDEKEFVTKPFRKAVPMNRTGLFKEVDEALKDWGKYGQKIYWRVVI